MHMHGSSNSMIETKYMAQIIIRLVDKLDKVKS